MMRTTITLTCLVAALGGCSSSDGFTGPNPNKGAVTVTADAFTPPTVRPAVGGVVVWTWNSGGVAHNIEFEDHNSGSAERTSGTFSRTFYQPGTYRYRCTIHSTEFGKGMSGQVIVPDPEAGE